jgi:hypothetical protein
MALGCFFWFGYQWYISYGSLKWPAHTGSISEVKIESQSRSRSSTRIYSPRVFYHFVHDHVSYEGSELLNSSTSLQAAQQSAAMWQHNQRLQVYYDPHHPQQNRLHQGEQLSTDALFAGIAFFVSFCIICSFGFDLKMR